MRRAAQFVLSAPFRWLVVVLAVLAAGFYSLEEAVDACDAAQHRLSSLTATWTHEPLPVAEALRPAWDAAAAASSAPTLERLDPAAAECCRTRAARCAALRMHAEPLLEFLRAPMLTRTPRSLRTVRTGYAYRSLAQGSLLPYTCQPRACRRYRVPCHHRGALEATVAAPRRRALAQAAGRAPPRVLVVGAGPAGLPAALVAHAEGAEVTVVEKREGFGRQV